MQESFRKVIPNAGPTADLFHDRLFAIAPEMRGLFLGKFSEQGRKLIQMLAIAVNGLGNLDMIVPAVRDLGRRHGAHGAVPLHCDVVGATLLWALEQVLGEALTPDVAVDWAEACGPLPGVMTKVQEMAAA